PTVGAFPSPQVTWMLLGLLHYRLRKVWAWRTLRTRLGLRRRDALHSDARGIVPGLPDWRYVLMGWMSALFHRGTGEQIEIDAINGPDPIGVDSFVGHYVTHREPGPAERRLTQ